MTASLEAVQADWIASLKSQAAVIALLPNGSGEEIREAEYQSDKFEYPNIRVSTNFMPNRSSDCGPDDADILIEIFSEEKSSKQAAHLASIIASLYHGIPFRINGRRYSVVTVEKVSWPNRSIYAWNCQIHIRVQVV